MRAYVWLSEADGSRRRLLSSWLRLRAKRQHNAVGRLDLWVDLDAPVALTRRNARLEIWTDAGLLADGVYFVRAVDDAVLDGVPCLHITAPDQIDILISRIVAAPAGSAGAVKEGPADIVLGEYVDAAFSGPRADPIILVEGGAGVCPVTYKTAPRRVLLGVCQDVARSSAELGTPLFFDFVPQPTGILLFRMWAGVRGVDHRRSGLGPVALSATTGTLSNIGRGDDWRGEITTVYAAGQGLESQRLVAEVSDPVRAAGPLARRERFVDARHLSDLAALEAQAGAVLAAGRPTRELRGVAGVGFGTRWNYGDLVEADDGAGGVVDARVARIEAAADGPDTDLVVTVGLVDLSAESAVSLSIEQQLEETATQESGSISATPIPHGIPQSGADGTLADGWFSAMIARLADLAAEEAARAAADAAEASARVAADAAEAAARAAADAAHAALTTGAHGGIVASSDARLTDARTPTAHASSHQAGSDPLNLGAVAGAQAANLLFAGPASGAAANPAFRALAAADVPALDTAKIATGALPPARGGTGVTALPAFLVNKGNTNQTGITTSTFVKVTWANEVFDNNSNFASNRFTPTVAGTYLISAALRVQTGAGPFPGAPEIITSLYKNGAELMRASAPWLGQGVYQPFLTTVVSMNGLSDYLEIYVFQYTGVTQTIDGYSYTTFFAGAWVAP